MNTTPTPEHAPRPLRPRARDLLLGLAISVLLAWVSGLLFLNSVPPLVLDPDTGQYVYPEGSHVAYRSEGWGDSLAGPHGSNGQGWAGLDAELPVVFWGDSFVQAFQVDDDRKMDAAFTRLCQESDAPCAGVGIGRFADSLADYYFKMQRYAPLLPENTTHVIVFGQLTDTLPDQGADCRSRFMQTAQGFALEERFCSPKARWEFVRSLLYRYRLSFLGKALNVAKGVRLEALRPVPNSAPASASDVKPSLDPPEQYEAAWAYLVQALADAAHGRLMIVYAPQLLPDDPDAPFPPPFRNPQAPYLEAFANVCNRYGVDFMGLYPEWHRVWSESGRTPFGFANSRPGRGHFNVLGHELVARAVFDRLFD